MDLTFSPITFLKTTLPETSWSWVIPALKHDPVIWGSLLDQELFNKVAKTISEPKDWSPHRIAAVSLDINDIKSLDDQDLEGAMVALDNFIGNEGNLPPERTSLEAFAQISAGMVNRYTDNYQSLLEELSTDMNGTSKWETALAIFFGIVPDQLELLNILISGRKKENLIPLAMHGFLCQPIPDNEQRKILKDLLTGLSIQDTFSILRYLNKSRPELTFVLANEWLINQSAEPSLAFSASNGKQFSQLTDLLQYADIYTLAGQLEKAGNLKSRALNICNSIHAQISNDLVGKTLLSSNLEQSLSLWTSISNPTKISPPASLVIKLLQSDRIEDSLAILPETEGSSETPVRWLTNIYQALKNEDIPQARLFAHQALNSINEIIESGSKPISRVFGSQQDALAYLRELIFQLTNLACLKEAYQAAFLISRILPDDPETLIILTKTSRAAGDYQESINAAELATAIDPTNPEYRRQLATSLESTGNWISALQERQAILEHRFAPPSAPAWPTADDLLALANCSIKANQPQNAFEVCHKAIELDPSNGQAHALLGEALNSLGETEKALEHFDLATQLAPHKAAPWLALAKAYQRTGQIEKSKETLRTASHAVPEDPSLFYALGQLYIKENSPSQAQSALERAYNLITEPSTYPTKSKTSKDVTRNLDQFNRNREQLCEISLSYGNVLTQLGHAVEANQVFEKAFQAHPSFPGLAYIYAKSIMSVGDDKSALAPLTIAVAAEPAEAQPYIDYASVLLSIGENPPEAEQCLQKALEILHNPKNDNGSNYSQDVELVTALLAQAQEASGDFQAALMSYSQALETDLGRGKAWKTNLALGMGRVAIKLDQPEVAIAALQDTDRDEIQIPEVAQILCKAYSAISLTQEALFAARTAVHLAPDDIEILSWFADQAVELGVIAESIPALTRAAQLAQKRTDLIIRLGQVYFQMGKEKEAKDAFLSALSSPYSTPEDLYKAADGLSDLGDQESAAGCLERALELQPHPPIELIIELAHAYSSASKPDLAIRTIEKGVNQDPENAVLHVYKAQLLSKTHRNDAAQACLEHALILEPENPYVHLQIAYVMRNQGDFNNAFEHAMVASGAVDNENLALAAKGLVLELARSNLREDSILEFPENKIPEKFNIETIYQDTLEEPSLFEYHCILVENALEVEEQIAAATVLNDAFLIDPEHPRVLALQSRMALRQGDRESALKSLEQAINLTKDPEQEDVIRGIQPNTLLGIAFSAIELYQWDLAMEILDKAASLAENDAFIHLQRVRLLVERAEFQRLCYLLDIVHHAPGATALSPRTFRIFEESIQEVINCLSEDLRAEQPLPIKRWKIRGEVAFHPERQAINTLEIAILEPSDHAAILLDVAQIGDPSATAQLYHSIQSKADSDTLHHCIYAAYALALISSGKDQITLEQAKEAIQSALDQNQTEAIYHVIQAKVAEKFGDWHSSLTTMETALTIWSDEPRWHSYLGGLYLLDENLPEAIAHYRKAINMESDHLQHYFDLSDAYLAAGQAGEAITVLRQSLRVAPDQVEPYLALANAQYENQEYPQAMKNAQLAAKIAPDEISPLLASAKIAMKMDDSGKAKTFAESALRINPESPEALHLQAQALSFSGQVERALNIVNKAIPLSSNPLPLLLQRARLITKSEGPQANLEALRSIAEEYPDEPVVLAPLAEALAESGNDLEAIQCAQQALHRSSGELPLDEQAKLHNLLGSLLQQSGQLDQSIHHLSEAIRISPSSLDSYLTLGSTQAERRQYEQALETYQQAIRMHPYDPRPYYQAGLLLKASRDYPAAEKMLRKAAEKAPDDISIHRQLAALVAINLVHNRQPVSSEV